MAQVLGLGGIFFKCRDVEATRAWYRDVLGLPIRAEWGGAAFPHKQVADAFPTTGATIWSPYGQDTDYFGPSKSEFMFNLLVDDLDAILEKAHAAGAHEVKPREDHDYGKFAWLEDPDGRRIELWQPIEPPSGS